MLQAIRDRAQGWIAWAIVIMISIPFALWGIQEYMGGGSVPVVASVNDTEITERELENNYHQFRQRLRQQLGSAYRPELFEDEKLRAQVLDDMIQREVVMQASGELGLYAGDQTLRSAIMAAPQFQKEGRFDNETYQRALQLQGLTAAAFEQRIRQSLVSNQLSNALLASEFITSKELEDTVRLGNQKREIGYLLVPAGSFVDTQDVSDDELRPYYEANPEKFRVPEQVKVEFLELDAEKIGATLQPDDATLRGYYESHQDKYGEKESRRASHILVTVATDAEQESVAAAENKISEALKRIQEGEDFAEVAKQVSEDPVSAATGGDLGFFGSGIMDPAFEEAAFASAQGEVVGPIRSRFGLHLIKVTDIKEAVVPSFEEKREQALEDYRSQEGERLFYDYAERMNNLSFESPDTLEPAATALGFEVQTGDWMSRETGGVGVLSDPKVVAAAFSEDVLRQGNNSEAIELGAEHVVVLRVVDHKEASIKPFDEVRDEIVATLRNDKAAAMAETTASDLLSQLKAGQTLEQVAAASGYELKQSGKIARNGSNLPPTLVATVFKLAEPSAEAPSYGMAILDNRDVAVVGLLDVEDGTVSVLDAGAKANEEMALKRSKGRSYYEYLVQHLKSQAKIEIRQR